ncbi:hypothetical protein DTO027B5_4119 [Paecilomyces variotii]|nr:hypothetical protein DTO169C6_3444 [Paecilomyces variotii]KAJ9284864.1 hypothetical protein DTO021C3_7497 [Paecilomyces variotii]KAJ9323367.1 hypothetical protein DTO027B3_5717 [Paecilomyces variotii]KAJ9334211.1 hypothetical protein DTO027B5_4119 [Paecilomyces variotii]KAJ9393978.1 hypothetical protein DTO282F9_9114 [Paecilomyces variotii]
MSLVRDPTAMHPQCHRRTKLEPKTQTRLGSLESSGLRKSASIASVSSFVRSSVTWATDTLQTYRDGLSREEREKRAQVEDRKQILYLRMRNAVSLAEWRSCASELDELENNNAWKETIESNEYYPDVIQERLKQLEDARISCDVHRMMFLVRTALSRDLGGMSNPNLYKHTHIGTKVLIDRYINTAVDTISTLVDLTAKRHDPEEMKYVLDQFIAARQAFGRSALLLSGGATFGMNHIGVLKALWEAKLLPRIMSGASAGSIVCAVFCSQTDDELPDLLRRFPYGDFAVFEEEGREENILQKTARFLKHGSFMDITNLARAMRVWLGDITFQESYNRSRRILNICVSSAGVYELPRLLNYITAPNVLIWSAVAVSCSVPLVFTPFVLMEKDPLTGEVAPWNDLHRQYIDGSVDGDLPMTRLAEMFNVNHFIVSQVNPHVVPFLPRDECPISDNTRQASPTSQWLQKATNLATEEVLYRMNVLSELGILSNCLTKASSILSQKYFGDINIFPEIPYSNFPLVLKNPTTEFMLKACLSGERATWPKLARIRNHLAIELALDRAVQAMRAMVALSPVQADPRFHLQYRSGESFDSNKAYLGHQRRSSYSDESERSRYIKNQPDARPAYQLRKARSTYSADNGLSGTFPNASDA